MQETGKQEIVSKLYLVRAILSEISRKRDSMEKFKIAQKEIELTQFKSKKEQKLSEMNNLIQEKKESLSFLHEEKSRLKENLKDKENQRGKVKAEKEKIENSKPMDFWGKLITVIILCGIPDVISYFLGKWWITADHSFWVGCLFFPMAVLSCLWTIFWIIAFILPEENKDTKKHESELCKIEIDIGVIENNIKAKDNAVLETSKKIQELEVLYREMSLKLNAEEACELKLFNEERKRKIDETEKSIIELVDETDMLYKCLKNNLLLDERDWQHLDLIIYEVETGRADSIKEALQQADQYIRHNELMQVMETATQAICVTIRESISELSSSIGAHLSGIKRGMSELKGEISELRISQEKMNSAFDTLLDEQEMTNALLEKSNVSSKQLADDISRMRWLRDQEFFKKGI